MYDAEQIEIAKKCIGLFMVHGNKMLCTPHGIKHTIEKFTDYFEEKHVYISRESAIIALKEKRFVVSMHM